MPKEFDSCRAGGGKIRTMKMEGGKYMHICILNGKSYRGEVKTKQTGGGDGGSPVAAVMKRKMK
jgi:hypothetical protein